LGYLDFVLPSAEQFPSLYALICEFIQQHDFTLHTQEMTDVLIKINQLKHQNWCTILPAYAKNMFSSDLVIATLAIDLPKLPLFINFNSQQTSNHTKILLEQLSKVFCSE
jgi:LysR family hca operon transcriptional activator